MIDPVPVQINDHLFMQLLSCPLKAHYFVNGNKPEANRPVYRQRNKLHLRDAVASRFSNVKQTSDEVQTALYKTKKWLKEDDVAICGAVIRTGNLLTRIPILLKLGDRFTIIQIHGKTSKKRWKRHTAGWTIQ